MSRSTGHRKITGLLKRWEGGDRSALDDLMGVVNPDLRRVAANCLAGESAGLKLEPTGLVNECYLRLVKQTRVRWNNRAQFFSLAARLMRRILVDRARRKGAVKRTEARPPWLQTTGSSTGFLIHLDLDEALGRLRSLDPRQARVVELRFLAGLTVGETAKAVGVSPRTVKLDWRMARAFLARQLSD